MRRAIGAGLVLALIACATPPTPNDAGPSDAGPLTLALGTGADAFAPMADDQTLELARGCQGLQHVWIALAATGIAPRGVRVHLSLERASDGVLVSSPFGTDVTFVPATLGVEASGLTLVVPMPDLALGEPLVLRAQITDRDGRTGDAERRVRVVWGTEVCGT